MMEEKLRVASIGLFMRTLINELDARQKTQGAVLKIANRNMNYINKNFKTNEERNILRDVVNEAWENARNMAELKEITVSTLVLKMFDGQYRQLLTKKCGFNAKHFQSFYDKYAFTSSLRTKFDSRDVAEKCIEFINKAIYNKIKEIG